MRLKKEKDIRKAAKHNEAAERGTDLVGTQEEREGASLSEGTSDASANNEICHSSPGKNSCVVV